MRLIMPLNALPGPTSTYRVTPSDARRWTTLSHRTGDDTCRINASIAAPADGVYGGWLTRADTGERYPAAISVGTNPTFAGERDRRVEAYALDRDDLELYGVEVEVSFVERLRGMVAFDSVEDLVRQMAIDVDRARDVLGA